MNILGCIYSFPTNEHFDGQFFFSIINKVTIKIIECAFSSNYGTSKICSVEGDVQLTGKISSKYIAKNVNSYSYQWCISFFYTLKNDFF